MTKDEALKLALEALETLEKCEPSYSKIWSLKDNARITITAIKEALAQPAFVQEPVAWLYPEGLEALQRGKCWTAYGTKQDDDCNIPVYLNAAVAPKSD